MRFLTNEKDKKKYYMKDFPDQQFVSIWLEALNIKNASKMMWEYKILTNYVLDKMGGFDINGWKIRNYVD